MAKWSSSLAAFRQEDFAGCLAAMVRLIDAEGAQPDWVELAAQAALSLNDPTMALTLLARGLAEQPRAAALWYTAAIAWEMRQRGDFARTCADRALALAPASLKAQNTVQRLAMFLEGPGSPEAADATWQELLARPAGRPTVGACVVVLNGAERLSACLSSLTDLDEILVIDRGSTDATVPMAQRLATRVAVVPRDDLTAARNAGLAQSTTDWVLILEPHERLVGGVSALRQSIEDHGTSHTVLCPAIVVSDGQDEIDAARAPRVVARRPDRVFAGPFADTVRPTEGTALIPWEVNAWHLAQLRPSDAEAQQAARIETLALATAWVAGSPADPDAHYHFGLALADLGQADEATAAFHQSLTLQGPDAGGGLAALRHLMGLNRKADWMSIVARGTTYDRPCRDLPDYWLIQGLAYAHLQQRVIADACFQQAQSLADLPRPAYETAGARGWKPALARAEMAASGADWAGVIALLTPVAGDGARQAPVAKLYLTALMAAGHFEEGRDYCQRLLTQPQVPHAVPEALTETLESMGGPGETILMQFPAWPAGFDPIARRLATRKAWHDLLTLCQRWSDQAGTTAAIYAGYALNGLGDTRGAEEAFRTAAQLNPNHSMAWHNLGILAAKRSDLATANSLFHEALRLAPQAVATLLELADVLARQGNPLGGVQLLDRVRALAPNHPGLFRQTDGVPREA